MKLSRRHWLALGFNVLITGFPKIGMGTPPLQIRKNIAKKHWADNIMYFPEEPDCLMVPDFSQIKIVYNEHIELVSRKSSPFSNLLLG
jgi:hypothetical protein